MSQQQVEKLDVVIIGAGLSGIGMACHLSKQNPDKSYAILEGRSEMGGTWDLFRYPGIRSDSDMYTFGYDFKPWSEADSIVSADQIKDYIAEAASEHGILDKIQYGQKVLAASWSSEEAAWLLTINDADSGTERKVKCSFLISCTGYYSYEAGYRPDFSGEESFKGDILHPQKWPEDYDYSGKKVVIIGSGATAVTLVPAMADKAAHVTMLQRSPSYVLNLPRRDPIAVFTSKILPEKLAYSVTRGRNIVLGWFIYRFCQTFPNASRKLLLSMVKKQLPEGYDMKHFSPKYSPWDERLCVVPDGDMFKTISEGKASVETDHIDRFTEDGILLKSGKSLDADIVVTATGLNVQLFGNMSMSVDGAPVKLVDKMCHRGVMIEGLPNLAMVFGYTNAPWTLKADMVSKYICRLLSHMDKQGHRQCTPRNTNGAEKMPFVDMQSGYLQRAMDKVPGQGSKAPWRIYQNVTLDKLMMRYSSLKDSSLEYSSPAGHPVARNTTHVVESSEPKKEAVI